MNIFSVAFLVQFVLFPITIVPTIGSAEVIQHDLHSVSTASEEDALASTRVDATGSDELPRALRKKRKKNPKGGKVSKSAKGSASSSPSSPPTSQDPCVVEGISTAKDALLALKAGFTNGDDKLSDWIDSTDPCTGDTSNWENITCSGGEVTEIGLSKYILF